MHSIVVDCSFLSDREHRSFLGFCCKLRKISNLACQSKVRWSPMFFCHSSDWKLITFIVRSTCLLPTTMCRLAVLVSVWTAIYATAHYVASWHLLIARRYLITASSRCKPGMGIWVTFSQSIATIGRNKSMMVSSFLTSQSSAKCHKLSQMTTTLLLGLQHWVLGLKNSDLVLENQFFSHISLHISFPTFLFHESGKNWFRLMGRFKWFWSAQKKRFSSVGRPAAI